MSDLREIIDRRLRESDLDLVDIVAIPQHGDPMVRLRTLEEALEEFSHGERKEGTIGYLIQVKPKAPIEIYEGKTQAQAQVIAQAQIASAPPQPQPPAPSYGASAGLGPNSIANTGGESIYLPNGSLNLPFLTRSAELLVSAGDYSLAKNIYRTILGSGERSALALYGIARCEESEGRFEEARTNYEESIAYHPNLDAYQHLCDVLIALGKDALAAEAFERALTLKDIAQAVRFEMHKACGNCWTRARNTERAEKQFEAALSLNSAADEVRSNLGALYLSMQRITDARRHFEDALASNPSNDKAQIGLGSCFVAQGDKRRAHDCFAQALEANINNPSAVFQLVKCAYEIKSYATAARIVEEYVQMAPVSVHLLYSLAGLQYHLGRMDSARATATQILCLNAEHAGAKGLLALIEKH